MKAHARYALLDALRGFSLLSMILYHATYDLVAIYGADIPWYFDTPGYLWQQSICWSFIVLSGMCWGFGRNQFKRGAVISACGLLITAVTYAFMPSQVVIMGVLSFFGAATLLMIPTDHLFKGKSPRFGILISALLFFVTRNVNRGYLGFEWLNFLKLPEPFYAVKGSFVLGFPPSGFYSSDYFSIVPWFFLFVFGYFLWKSIEKNERVTNALTCDIPLLGTLGRKSLIVYLLHQPLIMLALQLVIAKV